MDSMVRGVKFLPKIWSGRRDSNPRPSAWEADTLPTELLPHRGFMIACHRTSVRSPRPLPCSGGQHGFGRFTGTASFCPDCLRCRGTAECVRAASLQARGAESHPVLQDWRLGAVRSLRLRRLATAEDGAGIGPSRRRRTRRSTRVLNCDPAHSRLRHIFASHLVSSGESLHSFGKLLGQRSHTTDPAAFAEWLRQKIGPVSVDAQGRPQAPRA
jgi:hypothetical protein